jgi:PKD repeat protein
MKKNRTISTKLVALVMIALIVASCKKEPVLPTPDFTFEINDKTVSFTNTSTDADSYSWDFGDQMTSTETNPSHTYAAYGDYDVRLTAINSDGQNIKKTTISVVKEWPAITIDGNFSDWDAVESFYSGYGDGSGSLIEAKVTSDAALSKLYFYVKGDFSEANHVIQVMIDADGNPATGWQTTNLATNGAEYQFEYYIHDLWAGTYSWNSDEGVQDWPWDIDITNDPDNGDIQESSGVVGGNEIEFVIETSLMKNPVPADEIGIFFWAQNTDWNQVGQLPPVDADPLEEVKMFSFQ